MHDGFGFEFEFESVNQDGNFYVDNVNDFVMLTSMFSLEEVGLSFCGEVEVGQGVSIITDKQIKMENAETAIKTYQKVMEIRDLTEAEREEVSKIRLFFKKLFEVFFRNKKWRVYYAAFCSLLAGFDYATENYFGLILMIACILTNTSSIKFAKELKKMFGSKKRVEELKEELSEMNLMGCINSVSEDEGIQLYFKPIAPKM